MIRRAPRRGHAGGSDPRPEPVEGAILSPKRTADGNTSAGRPCLIPVRLDTATRVLDGLLTRLDDKDAWITLEEPFEGDREVFVYFKRPGDGHHVAVRGKIARIDPDGGLWRGHPAVHVRFAIDVRRAPAAEDSVEFSLDSLDEVIEDMPRLPPRPRTPERILSDLPVQFALDGTVNGGHASNFSATGLFISTLVQVDVGEQVHVHFPVPVRGGETLAVEFEGTVRWHPDEASRSRGEFGFGLEIARFTSAPAAELYALFVRQLTAPAPAPED